MEEGPVENFEHNKKRKLHTNTQSINAIKSGPHPVL